MELDTNINVMMETQRMEMDVPVHVIKSLDGNALVDHLLRKVCAKSIFLNTLCYKPREQPIWVEKWFSQSVLIIYPHVSQKMNVLDASEH